jgi:hypothetical protein
LGVVAWAGVPLAASPIAAAAAAVPTHSALRMGIALIAFLPSHSTHKSPLCSRFPFTDFAHTNHEVDDSGTSASVTGPVRRESGRPLEEVDRPSRSVRGLGIGQNSMDDETPRSSASGRCERLSYLPMTKYSRHYANDVHIFDPERYSARPNRFPQAGLPPAPIRRSTRLEPPEALTPATGVTQCLLARGATVAVKCCALARTGRAHGGKEPWRWFSHI